LTAVTGFRRFRNVCNSAAYVKAIAMPRYRR